jgi:hypothetical protein
MSIPSLALKPIGYKAGKLYSQLPTSGVGDFTVSRASTATRVNKSGLIETVGADVPRLDYSDGGCPVLLTEPQSTNEVLWSEELENVAWTKAKVSVSDNSVISPTGNLDGTTLVETAEVADHAIISVTATVVAGDTYTVSSYIKPRGRNVSIAGYGGGFTNAFRATFDTTTFTLINTLSQGDGVAESAKIEAKGNGWYRISVTGSLATDTTIRHVVYVLDGTSQNYLGDITKGVDLYGAQLEELSYATSYIKTEGTAITRVADIVSGAGDATSFKSSEGTLFLHAKCPDDNTNQFMGLVENTGSGEYIAIYGSGGNDKWSASVRRGTDVYYFSTADFFAKSVMSKIAVVWSGTSVTFYINGTKGNTQAILTPFPLNTFNNLTLDFSSSDFYGETKEIQVFNTELTEAEAITLTTL